MIDFLAQAAKEARQEAGIKTARVAVAADMDPATVYRFERGNWPGNADRLIAGYAEELEIAPEVLWARALKLWRADAASEPRAGAGLPPPPGELGRRVRAPRRSAQDRSRPDTDEGEGRSRGTGG